MTIYCPEIVDKLCELVSCGSNLHKIEKMEGMPTRAAVYLWMAKYPDFRDRYETARIARLETREDEFREAIENTALTVPALKKLELWLKMEMWVMEKINPRKYGQRTVLAGDKDNPLTLNLANTLDERIAARTAKKTIEQSIGMPVIDAESVEIES